MAITAQSKQAEQLSSWRRAHPETDASKTMTDAQVRQAASDLGVSVEQVQTARQALIEQQSTDNEQRGKAAAQKVPHGVVLNPNTNTNTGGGDWLALQSRTMTADTQTAQNQTATAVDAVKAKSVDSTASDFHVSMRARDGDHGSTYQYEFDVKIADNQATIKIPDNFRASVNKSLGHAGAGNLLLKEELVLPLSGGSKKTFAHNIEIHRNNAMVDVSIHGGLTTDGELWFGVNHLLRRTDTYSSAGHEKAISGKVDQRPGTYSSGSVSQNN